MPDCVMTVVEQKEYLGLPYDNLPRLISKLVRDLSLQKRLPCYIYISTTDTCACGNMMHKRLHLSIFHLVLHLTVNIRQYTCKSNSMFGKLKADEHVCTVHSVQGLVSNVR